MTAVGVSLLAACGSSDDGSTAGGDETDTPPATDGTEPTAAEIEFTGLAVLEAPDGPAMRFVDPAAAERLDDATATVALPDRLSGEWTRSSFSEDWQYAVAGSGGSFRVSRFDESSGEYVELFTAEPGDDSYSGTGEQYESALFAPTGATLWVEKSTADGVVLASVELTADATLDDIVDSDITLPEPSAGGDDPLWEFDSSGQPFVVPDEDPVTIAQEGAWRATYRLDESGGVVAPTLQTFADTGGDTAYRTIERIGPTEFVMAATDDIDNAAGGAATNGVISHVSIDPVAESLTIEPLVPLGAEQDLLWWAAVSPDLDGAAFCVAPGDGSGVGTAYYADLAAGSEPQERGDCERESNVPLDWS